MFHTLIFRRSLAWINRISKIFGTKPFSKHYVLLLAALSSSFFYLSWCSCWFGGGLLIAIVPMLGIIKLITITPSKKYFCLFFIFLTLLFWNTLTLWWLYKAAVPAFLFVAFANSLLMALPWFFYYYMRKQGGIYLGYLGLVTSCLTLEYIHLSWEFWELSFPWLNLGNGLAGLPKWIQWYEYTGVLGGSLWILIVNLLFYHLLFEKANLFLLKTFFVCLLIPISISLIIYYLHIEKGKAVEALVVQPNFDNYTTRNCNSRHFMPHKDQIDRLLRLSKQQIRRTTRFIVWPESAIDTGLQEERLDHYRLMQPIFHFLENYEPVTLITGGMSQRICDPRKITKSAKKVEGQYIDTFNSIFYLKHKRKPLIYHKQKRVPGGEYIPYLDLLSERMRVWIRKTFIDIADIFPCLAKGDSPKIFEIDDHIKISPIICYELLYGAILGSSVQKGANLLAVVTNDGWWDDTPVYHQFFQYTRLIAIAHRKSVIRAANTGISGFINQRGEVITATNRLEVAAIRSVVYTNNQITFYSSHGDYIGHIAQWSCLFLCCITWVIHLRKRNRHHEVSLKQPLI